jgi:hypothetical protein
VIPLRGPLIWYEITPEELIRPAGSGGSTTAAVAAVPVTFLLAAWSALVPRLKVVDVGLPPKAPRRSVQSAKNRNWALSCVAAVSNTRTLTVRSIPVLAAILVRLRPASEGHRRIRTTKAANVQTTTAPRSTGPVNDIPGTLRYLFRCGSPG